MKKGYLVMPARHWVSRDLKRGGEFLFLGCCDEGSSWELWDYGPRGKIWEDVVGLTGEREKAQYFIASFGVHFL